MEGPRVSVVTEGIEPAASSCEFISQTSHLPAVRLCANLLKTLCFNIYFWWFEMRTYYVALAGLILSI